MSENNFQSIGELFDDVVSSAKEKFVASVDLALVLGADSSKKSIRGIVKLPHGSGAKEVRVAAFSSNESKLEDARSAGCDVVGFESLLGSIGKSIFDFDVLISDPLSLKSLSTVAKLLGVRGLMPSTKTGTVVEDFATAVSDIKSGQVNFRADKCGNVHAKIGNTKFSCNNLAGNFDAVVGAVRAACAKSGMKGEYLVRAFVSSTMGASFRVPSAFLK